MTMRRLLVAFMILFVFAGSSRGVALEQEGKMESLIQGSDAVLVVRVKGRIQSGEKTPFYHDRLCTVLASLKGDVKPEEDISTSLRNPMPTPTSRMEWYNEGAVYLLFLKKRAVISVGQPQYESLFDQNSKIEIAPSQELGATDVITEIRGLPIGAALRRLLEFRIRLLAQMTLSETARLARAVEELEKGAEQAAVHVR